MFPIARRLVSRSIFVRATPRALCVGSVVILAANACASSAHSPAPVLSVPSPPASSSAPPPSAAPGANDRAPDEPESPRRYSTTELRRVAHIAAARCANGSAPPSDMCLLQEAVGFVKYDPADAECRAVAAVALSVAECAEFNAGCTDDQVREFVQRQAALEQHDKACTRADWGTDRERILQFAREPK